jgi:hypothetical protein
MGVRGLLTLMVVGAISAGLGLAGHRPAAPAQTLEQRLALVADKAMKNGPVQLGNGARITAIRAEGRVLHLYFSGIPDWRDEMSNASASKQIAEAVCSRGASMLAEGAVLKVELQTPGGAWLPPVLIDHC